jgi:hypothetical protein
MVRFELPLVSWVVSDRRGFSGSAFQVGGLVATGLTAASVATHYLGWGTLFGGAWGVALIAGLSAVAGYAAERWLPRLSAYVKELQHGRWGFISVLVGTSWSASLQTSSQC